MSKHVFTVVVAVVIALSLLMYLFMFQVRSDQTAVVLTFGKASENLPDAGIHLRWPWPIQQVNKFDSRMNVAESPREETLTYDQRNIEVSYCVGWRIADALKFNKNFGGEPNPNDAAWREVLGQVRHRVSGCLGKHKLEELVSVSGEKLHFAAIEEEMRQTAAEDALSVYGVDIALLRIKRIEFPSSVTKTVYTRMRAERNKEAEAIKKEGTRIATSIKTEAESKRKEILANAQGEAERIKGEGEAAAAQYYEAFAKNPELHKYLIHIETLKKVTGKNTTLIMDPTVPPFNVLTEEPPKTE